MKNLIVIIALTLIPLAGLSQKIKIKKGVVYVDAVAKHNIKTYAGREVTISNIETGKDEIFILYKEYVNPDLITKSNPKGTVNWIEINFLEFNKKTELSNRTRKGIIKFLIRNKVYVNGLIDEKAVDQIINKYGISSFTDAKPNKTIRVIIEN